MNEKDLLQTLTAIKVALQSGMCEDKQKMKMAIKIAWGFANNAIEEAKKPVTSDVALPYDDEHPDYIKSSQEEM